MKDKKRPYRTWLSEDIESLRDLIPKYPFAQVAEMFGVSKPALVGICFKNNIRRTDTTKYTLWKLHEIKQLKASKGLSVAEIASLLNRTQGSIRGYKKRIRLIQSAA